MAKKEATLLEQIQEALGKLDTKDDSQWTGDGLPQVSVMSELVGHKVTRAQVTSAAPAFTRDNPSVDGEEPEDELDDTADETTEELDEDLLDESVKASVNQSAYDKRMAEYVANNDKAHARLAELDKKLEKLGVEKSKIVKEENELIGERDALLTHAIRPRLHPSLAIKQHLKSESQKRAGKVEQKRKLGRLLANA
jgi:hypothetical protein